MLRGFIEWPQLISSTGKPKAAARRSRSSGLGVQRPSAMAATHHGEIRPLGDIFDRVAGLFEKVLNSTHRYSGWEMATKNTKRHEKS